MALYEYRTNTIGKTLQGPLEAVECPHNREIPRRAPGRVVLRLRHSLAGFVGAGCNHPGAGTFDLQLRRRRYGAGRGYPWQFRRGLGDDTVRVLALDWCPLRSLRAAAGASPVEFRLGPGLHSDGGGIQPGAVVHRANALRHYRSQLFRGRRLHCGSDADGQTRGQLRLAGLRLRSRIHSRARARRGARQYRTAPAILGAAALSLADAVYGVFVLAEPLPPERRSRFSWRRANPVASLVQLRRRPELLGLAGSAFPNFLADEVLPSVFVL